VPDQPLAKEQRNEGDSGDQNPKPFPPHTKTFDTARQHGGTGIGGRPGEGSSLPLAINMPWRQVCRL